ncbi:uncharacterized protein LOC133176403 [Saccostrea echinata]|uniref:uncharacterized protein LOC133176403 n=1 Tax=Saccostrea echinata TaxID=191078 RepID=UPI002A7F7893|nr:uncharacterized protein LOC133176403 [Saccostrea echinata]
MRRAYGAKLDIYVLHFKTDAFIWCCSQDLVESLVENAHVSCPSNDSCTAECYRGYILSNGEKRKIFNCQNNTWSTTTLVCKLCLFLHDSLTGIPVVSIKYYTIWDLDGLPKYCNNETMHNNISQRLEDSKQSLEKQFINICKFLNIEVNVNFTFSFRSFEVGTRITCIIITCNLFKSI